MYVLIIFLVQISDAGTKGARGATDPPIFGRSVDSIPTRGGQIISAYYNCPPPHNFFHHSALLISSQHIRSQISNIN